MSTPNDALKLAARSKISFILSLSEVCFVASAPVDCSRFVGVGGGVALFSACLWFSRRGVGVGVSVGAGGDLRVVLVGVVICLLAAVLGSALASAVFIVSLETASILAESLVGAVSL